MPRSEAQLAIRIRTAASIFLTFYMDTSHTPDNEPRTRMRDGEAGWVSYIVWMVGITDFSTLVYILFVGFSILR
ncbi:hypothetical protein OF83DRAFT_1173384 [Amylostereum chailletii]|nr:hypothetical protein OF83DRAFT_1173384 [Amylostereum chailletii]